MKRFSLLLMTLVTAVLASVSIHADEIAQGYYLLHLPKLCNFETNTGL